MRRFFLAASVLAALVTAPAGAQSVTNPPNFSDDYALTGFGANGVPTVGQTFTVPVGATYLNTFSFHLANDSPFGGGADLAFRPYLMAWAGNHPTGPNLLGTPGVYAGNSTSAYLEYIFNAGIPMTPGNVYVAFLSTAGVSQNGAGFNQFAGTAATYTGGQLVYAYTSPNGSDMTSPAVWYDGAGAQLAFDARFSGTQSTVPEPSELALLGTGFTGLVGAIRLRGRRRTTA